MHFVAARRRMREQVVDPLAKQLSTSGKHCQNRAGTDLADVFWQLEHVFPP